MFDEYSGPFPGWERPSAEECKAVTKALIELHGKPMRSTDPLAESCGGHGQTLVLDSLVRTILSQNTTDKTSIKAFISLKKKFPSWDLVLAAEDGDVEDSIRMGGLAAIKVQRIKSILQTLLDERGTCCLEWLRSKDTEDVKTYLRRFKGIGPKTISCVLMFCLQRSEFPVDTHVWHISKSLGWCPQGSSREQAYEHLNARVPDELKHDLHVLLVEHGKICAACNKSGRGLRLCPIANFKTKGKRKKTIESDINDCVKEEKVDIGVGCGDQKEIGEKLSVDTGAIEIAKVKVEDSVVIIQESRTLNRQKRR